MTRRALASLLLLLGLGLLLVGAMQGLEFGASPMQVGQTIVNRAPEEVGTANVVTSVVLAYRGLDTLGELTILFTAAIGAGLVLGAGHSARDAEDVAAGFILRVAADLLFPFLILVGAYIILHGHLTPGGGFQGGAILAAAFFVPLLAEPGRPFSERTAALLEGGAGILFIVIGAAALLERGQFLAPLLGVGTLGELFSAGSLPILYLAVGLKVGAELAGLLARMASGEGAGR